MPDGDVMPAWPVVELIERDEALTLLFSRWFLENAMRSACDLTEQTDSNVTLSMNLLPLYADRESFVDDVVAMLKKTGLKPQKMQFEVSEAQDLTERGIANLRDIFAGAVKRGRLSEAAAEVRLAGVTGSADGACERNTDKDAVR